MIGGASSSSNSRLNSLTALSHVYIQYPPLRCHVPGSRKLFYDDGNRLIISVTSNQVFSWKVVPYDPYVTASSDPIGEGPVLSIRYSLDLKLLAIQRSSFEIQIWNKDTGDTFSHKCRSESESILGFFWSDSPTCNLVIAKTSGLEFHTYNISTCSLQLVETKKVNISWYIYTHESRLMLLASGMQCKSFTGYQLSSVGIIRLPRFDMVMAKSETNSKPILAAEDVHIITVYGRIYCLQLDKVAMLLHVYRFYRDAVVQQGSLPVYSSRIAVSVVDNVLLVHQAEAKVVILYDFFKDSQAPISAPLPLLLRGFSRTNAVVSQTTSVTSGVTDSKSPDDTEVSIYGDQWNFLVPDLVCDVANGFLWKFRMDLEAISASSSEVPLALDFLQRRKTEAQKAKQLCLDIVHTSILERKPVPLVTKAIEVLLMAYSHAIKTGSYYKRLTVEGASSSTSSSLSRPEATVNVSISGENTLPSNGNVTGVGLNRSVLSTPEIEDGLRINPNNLGLAVVKTENLNSSELETSCGRISSSENFQIRNSGSHQSDSNVSEQLQPSVTSSAATSMMDLHCFVFAPVEEEMTRDVSYMISILIEFLRSAQLEKLKVPTDTYVLMVRILARDERYTELGLFILNKIIEASKEVALQLLESGNQNIQTRKLGMSMLRQLSFHHDYVLFLVQDGYYLESLRYARKNKVNTVQPTLFLEAAYASRDPQQVSAVLRFLSDFIPGFKNTGDCYRYHQIVAEMS